MDRPPPTPGDPGRLDRTTEGSPRPLAGRYPFLTPSDNPNDLGWLGRYRVASLLGEGGMGFVFRAEDDGLRRPIALKVMRPEIAAQPTARERFLREGRAAAAIKSDHVITIYDVGEENGVVFLAMEFLAGQNLDDWLKARPTPVPGKAVLRVAKDILKGLAAAHEKGQIHRDIKPANLWVDADTNRIKLLDFGLTRGTGAENDLTSTGVILGTPSYMAPEQARGQRVDGRADLFSVGVVLYRMITGKSPFARDEKMATLFAVAFDPVPPVASLGADIPDALGRLIDQLLAKGADDRPQSAKAALAVVAEVERQLRARQTQPVNPPQTPALVVKPPETKNAPATLLPGEVSESFEYVIEGLKQKGTRRVLMLDIGGGERMEFVRIDKGTFWMGAPNGETEALDHEKPQREVTFDRGFYLGKFVVTQAQYKAMTGKTPSHFKGDRLPVETVSWADAAEFCKILSKRIKRPAILPSEAQWEYACRAGTKTPFHFGSELNGDLANCDGNFPYGTKTKGDYKKTTVVVGSYPANPWGLYDMHGNVWEWCQDYYGPYNKVEVKNNPVQLKQQSEDSRVLRGGAWGSYARVCRASNRLRYAPDSAYNSIGFRVCLPLD